MKDSPPVKLSLVMVFLLCSGSLLAPVLSPHDPAEQNLQQRLATPSWRYPMGTDDLGRCVLSRILYGARVSIFTAIIIVGISGSIGTFIGLVSGTFGGVIDETLMRVVDIFLTFPALILALVIAGFLGPGLISSMISLAIVGWARYARIARGCTLSVKEMAFIEAAIAIGNSKCQIMMRHILPEILSPLVVMGTLGIGWTILSVATLSFLGLGAQPPMPEWGSMLNSGRTFLRIAPYLTAFPGLAIMVTVLAFNFLGEALRDASDPRYKTRLKI